VIGREKHNSCSSGGELDRNLLTQGFDACLDGAGVTPFKARLIALYAALICANIATGVWAFVLFSGRLGKARYHRVARLQFWGCATQWPPITSLPSTMSRENSFKRANGPSQSAFSLHSDTPPIVLIAAGIIAFAVGAMARFPEFFSNRRRDRDLVTSAIFLFAIAAMNLLILAVRSGSAFETVRKGGKYSPDDLDVLLGGRGPAVTVSFRPLFALIPP